MYNLYSWQEDDSMIFVSTAAIGWYNDKFTDIICCNFCEDKY